jgi:hypothetical protein
MVNRSSEQQSVEEDDAGEDHFSGRATVDISLPGVDRRNFMKASSITALGMVASSRGVAAEETDTTGNLPTRGKTHPTYYTETERQAALDNIRKYDWAREIRDETVKMAETVLSQYTLDDLWHYIGSQDIPRAAWLAGGTAGYYPSSSEWGAKYPVEGVDSAAMPGTQWTITNGEYTLPTNDFEKYRRSGLDDKGKFDPDLADDSLLVNEKHPEMGEGWGVDDGLGWVDENGDLGPAGQRWVPVAWTHHWMVVYGYRALLSALFHAYLYTREQQYARAASVLLDRIGDVYPEFSLRDTVYFEEGGYTYLHGLPNPSHGGTGCGKQVGSIWESYWVKEVLRGYDAVFPAQEGDNDLVSFLCEKTEQFPGLTSKESVADIRANIETGLLREILPAIKNAKIRGNFGSHQTTLALAAVIQDVPERYTGDALDFLFREGELKRKENSTPWGHWYITGGDVLSSLLGRFDRDGFPFEGSIHYNSLVKSAVQNVGDVLNGYDAYAGADLYQNAIFKQMFERQEPLVFLNDYVPQLGDSESTGKPEFEEMMRVDSLVRAYETYHGNGGNEYSGNHNRSEHSGDELAQWIYVRNGETTDGIRGGIFDPKPNSVTTAIERIIDAEGPLDIESRQLAGFGFTALHAGDAESNGRGIWTYYGRNAYGPDEGYGTSHCHRDTLNIGVFAHELNLAPDLGYPEETGSWPKRWNWTANTISHNTVLVNKHKQEKQWVSHPKRFDHTDRVQLFDVDATNVYSEADAYRRTTAQITVDEDDSYAVDFFRVNGGHDHHFSFHGAQTMADKSAQQMAQGCETLILRDGGGEISNTQSKTDTEESSVEITDASNEQHDWRGLAVRYDNRVTATVTISAALSGSQEYWPVNQSIYLGRDAGGRHICAGIGCPPDKTPRVGLFYPESGEWGEYEEITDWMAVEWLNAGITDSDVDDVLSGRDDYEVDDELNELSDGITRHSSGVASAWTRDMSLTLTVSVAGTRVGIDLTADGSTLMNNSFTLDSTTDNQIGVFSAIGENQTGRLLFEDFQLNGTPPAFFEKSSAEKSESGISTTGLELVSQESGTYAGPDVPKPDNGENTEYNKEVGNGFNYLYNVRRDDNPAAQFSVDWNINDYWNVRSEDGDVNLRLTMLEQVDDVALANGDPPQRWGNPDTFTYLVAHRTGDAVQTTFTSVIEPYLENRFVKSISAVPVTGEDPTARAVKVELENGRTDYVASASDHDTMHIVEDVFKFKGKFAVYAEDEQGDPEYAYLNDGKLLIPWRHSGPPLIQSPSGRIEGCVTDFTRDLSLDNTIEVEVTSGLSGQRSIKNVIGAWLYADAVDMRNGAYEIKDAKCIGGDRVLLDIGETTTVNEQAEGNTDREYEYILEPNGRCVIPLSETWTA